MQSVFPLKSGRRIGILFSNMMLHLICVVWSAIVCLANRSAAPSLRADFACNDPAPGRAGRAFLQFAAGMLSVSGFPIGCAILAQLKQNNQVKVDILTNL